MSTARLFWSRRLEVSLIEGGSLKNHLHQLINGSSQYNDWFKYLCIIGFISKILALLLYAWNRTLKSRLDSTIKDFESVALKDPLTDMYNRSSMIVYFERCRHSQKNNIFLAIIDNSGLQKLNKTQGFQKANHIIQSVARSIKSNTHKENRYYSL